jgi:hypothetical protein
MLRQVRFLRRDNIDFVAPQWGEAVNAAFMYRLTIGQVERDRRVVQLYLTPHRSSSAEEEGAGK